MARHLLTGSSVFSQILIDLSCDAVATNFPFRLTARAHTSPWWPSSLWIHSNWVPSSGQVDPLHHRKFKIQTLSPSQYLSNLSLLTVQK
jgi:hypothetical protein